MRSILLTTLLWLSAYGMSIFHGPNDYQWTTIRTWYTDRPIDYSLVGAKRIEYGIYNSFLLVPIPTDLREIIEEVLQFYSNRTCLRFREVTSERYLDQGATKKQKEKIPFSRRTGRNYTLEILSVSDYEGRSFPICSSRWPGMTEQFDDYIEEGNRLFLGTKCHSFLTVAHEVAHALGLYHTHQRSDRDQYITLSPSIQTELPKQNTSDWVPYDYGSMMHYPASNFRQITTKDPKKQFLIGTRTGPAQSDLLLLNKLYKCFDKCGSIRIQCFNGGFQNPNNCFTCVCPGGFGSKFCETRAVDTCGATVFAEDEWKILKGDLTQKVPANKRVPPSTLMCHWHLKAPPGHKIELVIKKIGYCKEKLTCKWGGLEIKLGDFGQGGYKFCCDEQLRTHRRTTIL